MKSIISLIIVLTILIFNCLGQKTNTDSLIALLDQNKKDSSTIDLLFKIGDELQYYSLDSSISFYQKALDEAQDQKDLLRLAHANKKLGNVNQVLANYDLSNQYYTKALELYREVKDSVGIGNIYNNFATVTMRLGDYEESIVLFKKALDFRKSIGDSAGAAGTYNNLGVIYLNQGKFDLALEYIDKSIEIKSNLGDTIGMINGYFNLGMINSDLGNYLKAMDYYDQFMEIVVAINDENSMADCYNSKASVYLALGDFEKATKFYHKALTIKERLGIKRDMALCYNNLGILQFRQNNLTKSIEYYEKGISISKEIEDKTALSTAYINLGNTYHQLGENSKAKDYFLLALKLKKETNDLIGISASYISLATTFMFEKNYEEAKFYFVKAIEIKEEINDKKGLANAYLVYADMFLKIEDWSNALNYSKLAFNIAEEIGILSEQVDASNRIGQSNYHLGNYKEAAAYYARYAELKDSLMNIKKVIELENIEILYQTEKKEQQIIQQEIEIEKQKAENKAQHAQLEQERTIRYSVIGGLILVVLLVIFVFRGYRQKKKANQILEEKNEQINYQNEEINEKNEELHQLVEEVTAQKEEIEKQKSRIEVIHDDLKQSIDYAKRIQTSTLPDNSLLKNKFSDHFIFFRPRDIVSGDFYWWATVEDKTVIAVADCTGHGVPGAFMSMLGMSLLKEIVVKEYITHPGVILRKLRKEVINALKQKENIVSENNESQMKVNDGMDMALICIDHETETLQFAGANNPLYIVSGHELQITGAEINNQEAVTNNQKLYEIKGDKMPISIYLKMDKFSIHEIKLNKGDQLYMFSDGFADQFGGTKGKKFKYKPFKELLINNSLVSMSEQKKIITNNFIKWKGSHEQIDDVLVLGIKI